MSRWKWPSLRGTSFLALHGIVLPQYGTVLSPFSYGVVPDRDHVRHVVDHVLNLVVWLSMTSSSRS